MIAFILSAWLVIAGTALLATYAALIIGGLFWLARASRRQAGARINPFPYRGLDEARRDLAGARLPRAASGPLSRHGSR